MDELVDAVPKFIVISPELDVPAKFLYCVQCARVSKEATWPVKQVIKPYESAICSDMAVLFEEKNYVYDDCTCGGHMEELKGYLGYYVPPPPDIEPLAASLNLL
jgi:hypothetical protein